MPDLTSLPPETLITGFVATYLFIALAATLFFRANRNARVKRATWVALIIAGDIGFGLMLLLTGVPWYVTAFAVVFMFFGARASIRRARFCDACGGNHFPMDGGAAPETCRHCGAPLEDTPRTPTVR